MSGPKIVALSDANNFYASCERALDPSLAGTPVVVLSNNDGCAVARSAEAKALGIRMGDPWFRIRGLCERNGVRVLSSNYGLYGDMSRRLNEVYARFSPVVEAYSIDESFLDLTGIQVAGGPAEHARAMREAALAATGIPTCVGLAPTKTLAKLANRVAKREVPLGGVCDLLDEGERDSRLREIPLGDVWGIGEAKAERLRAAGLRTAADLRDMDRGLARRMMTVVGERVVMELRGIPCIPFDAGSPPRTIAVTRSFPAKVVDVESVTQAVATHAVRAAERLRSAGLLALRASAFFHTGRFEEGPRHWAWAGVSFDGGTDDGTEIARALSRAAAAAWRPGFRYAKAGVRIERVEAASQAQGSLIAPPRERPARLSEALDRINERFGRETVYVASQGVSRPWATRAARSSGVSNTRIGALPTIAARADDRDRWSLADVEGAAAQPHAVPSTPLGRRALAAMAGLPPMRKSHVGAVVGIGRGSGVRIATRLAAEGHLVQTSPGWFTPVRARTLA